jgi:hypothetical protein
MVQFKQKCYTCKKNYVTVSSRNQYGVSCFECQEKQMQGEITDPKMKEMFDIPDEYYRENSFLRSIKINYLKYGNLSERQIEAFKSSVEKLRTLKDSGAEKVIIEQKPKAKKS